MNDEYFMRLALLEAQAAFQLGETPVGAVIVRNNSVVCKAHNLRETTHSACAHAELLAIQEACRLLGGWRLWECELYVTLEPCPMCAGAIIQSRISRIVYGARDPKAGCCGSVTDLFALPFNHHPEIAGGVLEQESAAMLSSFFRQLRDDAKAAQTAVKRSEERNKQTIQGEQTQMPEPKEQNFILSPVLEHELAQCTEVIHRSFATVAQEFGLTRENCPNHTSFTPLEKLQQQYAEGRPMFALHCGDEIAGYFSLCKLKNGAFELNNLAVLPEYRKAGLGKKLLEEAKIAVQDLGGTEIEIGIIEESKRLKDWYSANGFIHTGTKVFKELPFTVGFMRCPLNPKQS